MDAILYWNETALETHRLDFSGALTPEQGGPTATSRALAMVHLAMRDAWVFSDPAINPADPAAPLWYIPAADFPGGATPGLPAGASREAAVAGAALTVLRTLYLRPIDYLDQRQRLFAEILLGFQSQGDIDAGLAYGREVGAAMIVHRSTDGSSVPGKYVSTNACGAHRPDPYNPGQGYLGPNWGNVRLFTPGFAGVASKPYPAMGSAHYLRDFNEVKQKGALVSPTRLSDETIQGLFWAYDGAKDIGVPPRLYNQVVRAIAGLRGNSVDDNARLFALINMAMADAGIAHGRRSTRTISGGRSSASVRPARISGLAPALECPPPLWQIHSGAPLGRRHRTPATPASRLAFLPTPPDTPPSARRHSRPSGISTFPACHRDSIPTALTPRLERCATPAILLSNSYRTS